MMQIAWRCLRYLAFLGDASVGDLAEAHDLQRVQVYRALYQLRRRNLVVRRGKAMYAVTRRGLRVATEQQILFPVPAGGGQ